MTRIVILLLLLSCPVLSLGDYGLRSSVERIEQRILTLGTYGANPEGGVSRIAFNQADIDGRHYLQRLMEQAGLAVRIDTAGNLIGRRPGREPLPPIVIGSHSDSVPGGGNYDGQVGVIGAIEVAQLLHENQQGLRHPLEVVVFSDEEGGLTGSRAMIGELTGEALAVVSHSGLTVAQGIRNIGGDPTRLAAAQRHPGDIAAFIELHIEQGAVLEDAGIEIGVVTGIVGIEWWEITITGVANHAGTTPMNKRQDAMLAAAELTLAINRVITTEPGTQVGTVGRIAAEPGAPNVIPGRVVMSLEIRDLSEEKIWEMYRRIKTEARAIGERHGTRADFSRVDAASPPAVTDPRLRSLIARSAEQLGLSYKIMPSGAGHDAQDMARIAPTGMIFVPSAGGISHSPNEYTSARDMANGVNVLLHTVLSIDRLH